VQDLNLNKNKGAALVETFIGFFNALVWGADNHPWIPESMKFIIQFPPVLILLLGTGLFLLVRLGFMPLFRLPYAFGQLFKKRDKDAGEGDVSPLPNLPKVFLLLNLGKLMLKAAMLVAQCITSKTG